MSISLFRQVHLGEGKLQFQTRAADAHQDLQLELLWLCLQHLLPGTIMPDWSTCTPMDVFGVAYRALATLLQDIPADLCNCSQHWSSQASRATTPRWLQPRGRTTDCTSVFHFNHPWHKLFTPTPPMTDS